MKKAESYMAVVAEMDRTPVGARPPKQAPPPKKNKTLQTHQYNDLPRPVHTITSSIRRRLDKPLGNENIDY